MSLVLGEVRNGAKAKLTKKIIKIIKIVQKAAQKPSLCLEKYRQILPKHFENKKTEVRSRLAICSLRRNSPDTEARAPEHTQRGNN